MKKIIKIPVLFLFLLIAFCSCKKDENRISFNGGTPPVLTSSTTADMVLIKPNAKEHAITFSWTNPEYQFTTGISSQDVTYYLQVDTAGSGFTTPPSELSVSKDLTLVLNDSLLNHAVTLIGTDDGGEGLKVEVPHTIEFRIKSTLSGNTVPLYSNVITVIVTPYLDVAIPVPTTDELYVTGSGVASGWTNDPDTTQRLTRESITKYSIILNLVPGGQLKFLSTLTQWQPQYGQAAGAPVGTLALNPGGGTDPDGINTPATAGKYKVTLNFVTGKYTFELQ